MCLALNLVKPKDNRCFCFPKASCDPGGTIRPTTPVILVHSKQLASDLRCGEFATSCAWQSHIPPFAGREPLIVKIYIHKLPIHRMRAAGQHFCDLLLQFLIKAAPLSAQFVLSTADLCIPQKNYSSVFCIGMKHNATSPWEIQISQNHTVDGVN